MCPILDLTKKSLPSIFVRVLDLAGDSTITRYLKSFSVVFLLAITIGLPQLQQNCKRKNKKWIFFYN
jgi:hypothetical protein